METKRCKTCMIEKDIYEFRISNGYTRGDCRKCENDKCKIRNARNIEHIKEKQKEYRETHREQIKKYKEGHYDPIKQKEYNREYYKNNKDYYSLWHKEYSKNNREKLRQKHRQWRDNNRDKYREYQRKDLRRRMNDPILKVELQLRNMIYMSFKRKKYTKNKRLESIVGLNSKDMVNYLFETYKNNYGYEWNKIEPIHIDHIVPLATAKNEEDVIKLCHYTNLQLLKAEDNIQKSDKLNWDLRKALKEK